MPRLPKELRPPDAPKLGRPFIKLTDEQLETMDKLATIHCTASEIASILGVSKDTLERNYAAQLEKARDKGKASLRRRQFIEATENGNTGMLVWLGKNILGQKDRHEVAHYNEDDHLSDDQLREKILRMLLARREQNAREVFHVEPKTIEG